MKQTSASPLSAIETRSRTVQAREGLHLMEWKHQEAGPSVSTPLLRDNETMAHPSMRIKRTAHKKTADIRATLVPAVIESRNANFVGDLRQEA
jgi:hypothetical protein